MKENEKRIIDKAIESIDEKYINETAEELKKHISEPTELTEIIVDKSAVKKSFFPAAVKIGLASAAGLGLIIGAGILLKNGGLAEISPSNSTSENAATSMTVGESITTAVSPNTTSIINGGMPSITEIIETPMEMYGRYDPYISMFDNYMVKLGYDESDKINLRIVNNEGVSTYETELEIPFEVTGNAEPDLLEFSTPDYDVVILKIPHKDNDVVYDLYFFTASEEKLEPLEEYASKSQLVVTTKNYSVQHNSYMNIFMTENDTKQYYNIVTENNKAYVVKFDRYEYAKDKSALNFKELEFATEKAIFLSIFNYQWQLDMAERNIFTPSSQYIAETDEGWFLYETVGGEPNLYFVSKNNTEVMYCYYSFEEDLRKCDYFALYRRSEKEVLSVHHQDGTAEVFDYYYVTLGKNSESGNSTLTVNDRNGEIHYYDTGIPAEKTDELKPKISTHTVCGTNIIALYTPSITQTFTLYGKERDYDDRYSQYKVTLYICTDDEIIPIRQENKNSIFTTIMPLNYELVTDLYSSNICFMSNPYRTSDSIKRYFYIDLINSTIRQIQLTPLDYDRDSLYMKEPQYSTNQKAFEDVFYGKWEKTFDDGVNGYESLNFTYYGDASYSLAQQIAETEDGWLIKGVKDGVDVLHYISKDDPDTIYSYSALPNGLLDAEYTENGIIRHGTILKKCNYICAYKRVDSARDYDDKSSVVCGRADGLTTRGVIKLEELTGYDINETPSEVTDNNGVEWQRYYGSLGDFGTGKNMLHAYNEKKVVYSKLFSRIEIVDGFEEEVIDYLKITAEKTGNEWQITSIVPSSKELS